MANPKKPMLVKLVTVKTVTATYGDTTLENLKQTGEWEGLIKLQNEAGHELIVEETDVIGDFQVCRVIKGSAEMLEELSGAAKKTEPPTPGGPPNAQTGKP